jgi:hypothetical protein
LMSCMDEVPESAGKGAHPVTRMRRIWNTEGGPEASSPG